MFPTKKILSCFRLISLVLLITRFCFNQTLPVLAHVLKTDGNIGLTLHIDPDDDPIIGQLAIFYIYLKDTSGQFQPQNCTCGVSILQNQQSIFSTQLYTTPNSNDLNTAFQYTFSKPDIYTIVVSGQPKANNSPSFQAFRISFDWRVSRTNTTPTNSANSTNFPLWLIISGASSFVIISVLFVWFRRRRSKILHSLDKKV